MQPRTETQPTYPQAVAARFSDAYGDADAVVAFGEGEITLQVYSVDFVAYIDFEFEAVSPLTDDLRQQFIWDSRGDYLANFRLSLTSAVPVVCNDETLLAPLDIRLEQGNNSMRTELTLVWADIPHTVSASYCEFECLLDDLARRLPPSVYLKNCYNCLYSDYSPFGKSGFGDMQCHRNEKAAYLAVKTKRDYFEMRNAIRVQETFLCPEWEKRIKGTGYCG